MMHHTSVRLLLIATLVGALGGCLAEAPGEETALQVDLEEKVNAYAQALFESDVAVLETILSSEVLLRAAERGVGMAGFAENQRGSMLRTFGDEMVVGPNGRFTVVEVAPEGEAVLRATLAYRGKDLEKPFFFVLEEGEYKLNVRRPGFSQPLPAGAAAGWDSYKITSERTSGTLYCRTDKDFRQIDVPLGRSVYASCWNVCGWWSGSTFEASGWRDNCDWNTWGTDVWVGSLNVCGRLFPPCCNDRC